MNIKKIRIWSEESTRSVDFMDSWSIYGFHRKTRIWIFSKKKKNAPNERDPRFLLSLLLLVSDQINTSCFLIMPAGTESDPFPALDKRTTYEFVPILCLIYLLFVTRLLRRDIVTGNNRIRLRRRRWQIKLLRLTATAITAFMLSWSPYCLVSMISIFRGNNVLLAPGEAEVPALMAKASAIYNPIVYTVMNRRFRMILWRSVSCRSSKIILYPTTLGSSRQPECRKKSYTITSTLSA